MLLAGRNAKTEGSSGKAAECANNAFVDDGTCVPGGASSGVGGFKCSDAKTALATQEQVEIRKWRPFWPLSRKRRSQRLGPLANLSMQSLQPHILQFSPICPLFMVRLPQKTCPFRFRTLVSSLPAHNAPLARPHSCPLRRFPRIVYELPLIYNRKRCCWDARGHFLFPLASGFHALTSFCLFFSRLRIVYETIRLLHDEGTPHRKYFHYKHDICSFIDRNWAKLCPDKKRTSENRFPERNASTLVPVARFSTAYGRSSLPTARVHQPNSCTQGQKCDFKSHFIGSFAQISSF